MTGGVSAADASERAAPPASPPAGDEGGSGRGGDEAGVREPETIEGRGERARIASWRSDGLVAHLSPAALCPLSAAFVDTCLETLRARGFTSVITSALSVEECDGFLRSGFRIREELELLGHDLAAIPDVAHRLRRARRRDRPGVLELDAVAFESFWRLHAGGLEDALAATPAVRFRVHGPRRQPDGYVIGGLGSGTGYVQRLAVHPGARGHGLGRSLVGDALRWMRRRGAQRALVNTQQGNQAALGLYRACGFKALPEGLRVLARAL